MIGGNIGFTFLEGCLGSTHDFKLYIRIMLPQYMGRTCLHFWTPDRGKRKHALKGNLYFSVTFLVLEITSKSDDT